jgi:ABC-type nitrate/sulfonate/bicarbonate transport system permease component
VQFRKYLLTDVYYPERILPLFVELLKNSKIKLMILEVVCMSIFDIIEKGKKQRKLKERKRTLQNAAVGAAIGVTVGAAAGLLLAPKAGKETRADIAQAAKELPAKAKEIVEKTREKVEDAKKAIADKKDSAVAVEG